MILSGKPVDAGEAYRIGLVNRVVDLPSLLSASEELAERIVKNAPLALEYAINAVDQGLDADLETGLHLEATLFGNLAASDDWREGMDAFLTKRKASFKGR